MFTGSKDRACDRVERIMGRGNGGIILVRVGTNNADKEGTTAVVEKYRKLLQKTKQARVGEIIISGILPVVWEQDTRIQKLGFAKKRMWDTWICGTALWGKEDMYTRDGLHLSGKGAAVFAEGLSGTVASGLGKVRYLN